MTDTTRTLKLVHSDGSGLDRLAVHVACTGSTAELRALLATMMRRGTLACIRPLIEPPTEGETVIEPQEDAKAGPT